MRKLHLVMISAAMALTFAEASAANDFGTDRPGSFNRLDGHSVLAFTLEEMNCFSSDVRALEPAATNPPGTDETLGSRVAASGGTNGIPCDPRDPKAPPKKKRSRS